ncbi:MAG TPA: hypothetical protein VHY59_02895, partial [Chthoniobacterales bacterium]|nr:hypothetical protein [Chthoniobacterales bacterium]
MDWRLAYHAEGFAFIGLYSVFVGNLGDKSRFFSRLWVQETQIEASFCEAIRIAKEQKSVSLEKRAEATYAEYRRRKVLGEHGFRLSL